MTAFIDETYGMFLAAMVLVLMYAAWDAGRKSGGR